MIEDLTAEEVNRLILAVDQAHFYGLQVDEDGKLVAKQIKKYNFWEEVNAQKDYDPRIDEER